MGRKCMRKGKVVLVGTCQSEGFYPGEKNEEKLEFFIPRKP